MDEIAADEEQKHFKSVCAAFFNYQVDSMRDVSRIERNFRSLKQSHLSLLPQAYTQRISKLIESVNHNYYFLVHIVHPHNNLFVHSILPDGKLQIEPLEVGYKNVSKVRSTLRQIVRDWSKEGAFERNMCYSPILQELQRLFPVVSNNGEKISVLTPGAGLGRLTFEIARLGYKSQGNEFSYFMLLTSDFILNKIEASSQFSLFPFIHDFSNVLKLDDVFKRLEVPDVCPADVLPADSDFSMVAGEFVEVYSKQIECWDCIITCFFMDTANNIIQYVETIFNALKPGGKWINFGPLLYHYADMSDEMSIELSWEEFRSVVAGMGFVVEKENQKEAVYASDINPMLRITYNCIFFTACKPENVN
jgi:carnosine N-methyltransferase